MIMSCHYYCLRRSTQWNPFNDAYLLCPNLIFLASPWLKIDFQTGYFAAFEQFKTDIYFANFWQVRIDSICSLLLTLVRSVILVSLGELCSKKQSKLCPSDKNSRTMHRSGTSYMPWFNQWESRTGFLSQ